MKHAPRSSNKAEVFSAFFFALCLLAPSAASPAGVFDERGGLVVVEVESEPAEPPWVEETFVTGFTGASYYRMDGNTFRGGTPLGRMSYFININEPGAYRLIIHSYKNNDDESLSNDCFTRMVDHPGYQGSDTKTYLPGRSRRWSWETMHEPGQLQLEPVYTLEAGVHELQISGRSKDFHIDRFVLFADPVTREQAEDLLLAESPLVEDTGPWDSGGTRDTGTQGTDPDTGGDTEAPTDRFVIEAEHMTLDGFALDPDDPDFIFVTQDEGEAWTVFGGEDGFYHLSAVVGLEPDGRPRLALLVGDALVGEAVYERATDTSHEFVPHTVELGDAEVLKGEEIRLHGMRNEQALARVDKLILSAAAQDTGDTAHDSAGPDGSDSHSLDTGSEEDSEEAQTDASTAGTDSWALDTDTQTGGQPEDTGGSDRGCGCRSISAKRRTLGSAQMLDFIRIISL